VIIDMGDYSENNGWTFNPGRTAKFIRNVTPSEFAKVVFNELQSGKTKTQAAVSLKMAAETLNKLIDKHPEVALAVQAGKDAAKARWEQVLQTKATTNSEGDTKALLYYMNNVFKDDYSSTRDNTLQTPPVTTIYNNNYGTENKAVEVKKEEERLIIEDDNE
jgi:hypothetical protein